MLLLVWEMGDQKTILNISCHAYMEAWVVTMAACADLYLNQDQGPNIRFGCCGI